MPFQILRAFLIHFVKVLIAPCGQAALQSPQRMQSIESGSSLQVFRQAPHCVHFCGVDFDAIERDFIENAVNCSKGAYIAAEGAVKHNCRKQRDDENRKFPAENKACRSPNGRVHRLHFLQAACPL